MRAALILALSLGTAAPLFAAELKLDSAPAYIAENGEASIALNAPLLDALGLQLQQSDGKGRVQSGSTLRWSLLGRYGFDAPGDHVSRFYQASLALQGGITLRVGKRERQLNGMRIEPRSGVENEFALLDQNDALWFVATHAHHHVRGALFELKYMDLRAGPAFDAWFGDDAHAGMVLGTLALESPLLKRPTPAEIESCAVPNWPNTPGAPGGGLWRADVLLESMGTLQGGGCVGGCDGPAGANTGLVKFTPSATLRNANNPDTAEVPWYQMFTQAAVPYGNDQHPYLIWNVYRQDSNGRFVQLARSGVKHAFYTINVGCAQTCNSDGRILGLGCADVYSSGTNDSASSLGKRSEIVPSKGVWGRCGSTRDPGCTGNNNFAGPSAFQERALAIEGELDPTLNVGSQYFFDGWYVVRDDINIFNTMGSQGFTPTYSSSVWAATALTSFVRGATIDRWVSPNNPGANAFSATFVTDDGQLRGAVRAIDLGGGRWRYNYAVMNFDFSRATISGTPPNTRVEDNRGVVAVVFGKASAATVENLWFFDGDNDSANNWAASISAQQIEFRRDSGNDLAWGSLYSFGFESNQAPSFGALELVPGRGTPDRLRNITLTPGGAEPSLFASNFD